MMGQYRIFLAAARLPDLLARGGVRVCVGVHSMLGAIGCGAHLSKPTLPYWPLCNSF